MKILVFLGVALLLYRVLRGRWPWKDMGGEQARDTVRSRARVKALALLGVRPNAGREEIIDAHRRLIAQVHPDRGGTSELVHEANSARDLLLGEIALSTTEHS